MKKFLPYIFILILVIGFFSHASSAYAVDAPGSLEQLSKDASVVTGGSFFGAIMDAILFIPGWVSVFLLQISHLLVWLSGAILNYAVQYSVVDMKMHLDKMTSINTAWQVIRDVANMSFIFILLYAAIKQIMGIGDDNKKLIINIVVVAILINFSLFATKFVIDVSNVVALTFYDAIAPGAKEKSLLGFNVGIADSLMAPLHLQSIMDATGGIKSQPQQLLIVGIMGTIFSLIAAFVFFAVAIMFIIRFVVLIFVLILSPLAFISMVLPQLKDKTSKWTDALIGQAVFAPVYFLLTWMVIVVSKSINPAIATGNFATAITGRAGPNGETLPPASSDIGILVNFIILIAMLITSLVLAKDWASKGGPMVGKAMSWATGFAGGATLGVAGRFGRGTLGRAGQTLAENEWLKDKAPTSRLARLGLAASRKTAGASFDVRGAGITGSLDAGKAQNGGFAKDLKDKIDAEKKYADSLKPSDILVSRAERELDNAKKTGTLGEVAVAQAKLDKIKGASEEDMRNRKIKEFRIERGMSKKAAKAAVDEAETARLRRISRLRAEGRTEEEAKAMATQDGLTMEFVKEKGYAVERKEAYAKDKESSSTTIPGTGKVIPFSFTGRVGMIGKVKRERLEEAIAIRKSIKEKKAAEKIADEIKNSSETAADEATTAPEPTTPPPAGGGPTT